MSAEKKLLIFKKKLDPEIGKYFDRVIKEAKSLDSLVTDTLQYVKKLTLSGGKRLRPAFMYYGYLAAGGRDFEKIIKASMSVELMHMFLLIHDDIIDRDNFRHGQKTINTRYAEVARRHFPQRNAEHFGNSIGIVVGDMIGAMSNQVIYELNIKPELIVRALFKLQDIISMTVIGEFKDIHIEYRNQATEEDVMKMYEYKTAKYTVEGPLHLGAILGGADDEFLKKLSAYAIPVGIAFQIQDDILGIYGEEKRLGKPVGSDIMSGKQTLLVVKARKMAEKKSRLRLDDLLGKKDLSKKEIEEFRRIIKDCGACDYAANRARELVHKGKEAITGTKTNMEAREFLTDIANYIINRQI